MSIFRCQHFEIQQANSGMKVCSDSLLFGALAQVSGCRVLDLGAGTGLLSLICAQHGATEITAVEIDSKALKDLRQNFCQSRWSEKLHHFAGAVQVFESDQLFDLIISNPPFFENSLKSLDQSRQRARHTDDLSYVDLLKCASKFLADTGTFQVLLPSHNVQHFVDLASKSGLFLVRSVSFYARRSKPSHVQALFFCQSQPEKVIEDQIVIWDEQNQYTESSMPLLEDLLLRFKSKK